MTLIQEEPRHTARTLMVIGIPSFILAVIISMTTHQFVHMIVNKTACIHETIQADIIPAMNMNGLHTTCPVSSAIGVAWTFFLAITSFAMYLRFPRNLFLGSLAFINASIRLPEAITVFFQLLFKGKATIIVDESVLLSLIRLNDPTVSVIFMCFCSLTMLFLTVTIIHDTKTIPWKWAVAVSLFIGMGPFEYYLWNLISPLFA